MANQPATETETTEGPRQRPAPRPNPLQRYLERVPPRYRNKRWLIGGPTAVLLLLVFGGDCLCKAARSERAPEPVAAVLEVAAPTATPEPVILANRWRGRESIV